MQLGSSISKASFAAPEMNPRDPKFLVAGWGKLSPKQFNVRDLHVGNLPMYKKNCQLFYKDKVINYTQNFCLGYDNQYWKTTYGDQGGPVFSYSLRVVYGMIVNGEGETTEIEQDNRPMLMAYIWPVRAWIDEIYDKHGFKQ